MGNTVDTEQATAVHRLSELSKDPKNAHRNLVKWLGLGRNSGMPKPYYISVPVRKPNSEDVVFTRWPILLPHEMFGAVHQQFKEQFDSIVGTPAKFRRFWRNIDAAGLEIQNHPILKEPGYTYTTAPIRLHGDGVPYLASSKGLKVGNFSSIVGEGWSMERLFMGFAIPGTLCVKPTDTTPGTMEELWRHYLHSFDALVKGKVMDLDADGNAWTRQPPGSDIAGGLRGAVCMIAGDLKEVVDEFGLRSYGAAGECCFRCHANRTTRPWSDFAVDALWRGTMMTPEAWAIERPKHPIWENYLSVFNVFFDGTHVVHLGVIPHALGSAIWCLVREEEVDGATLDARTSRLWVMLQDAYREKRTKTSEQMHRLTRADFEPQKAEQFAFLKIKAAQARHLVPAMIVVLEQLPTESHTKRLRLAMFRHLEAMFGIIENGDMFLTNAEATSMETTTRHFLGCYQSLSNHYILTGHAVYNIVPKFHFMQHWAAQAAVINPKHSWVFGDEDFVSRIARIGASVARGTGTCGSIATRGTAIADKYLRLKWIRFRARHRVPLIDIEDDDEDVIELD
jgi:hypothetical protein